MTISLAYAKSLFQYNQSTGVIKWKKRPPWHFRDGQISKEHAAAAWNAKYSGSIAGTPHVQGYIKITVDYVIYPAHVLAFLLMTGRWPQNHIDHADMNGFNNRWKNIREATHAENGRNRGKNKNNKSGFKGVSFSKQHQLWAARIKADGWGYLHLGLFDSAAIASVSYNIAAQSLHGQFARTSP